MKKSFTSSSYSVCLMLIFSFLLNMEAKAFTADSTAKPKKKRYNSIRINTTSNLVFNESYQLSYERVVGKHQSFTVFGGYQTFPTGLRLDLEGTSLGQSIKKSGYAFGAEYRFYLPGENKYEAPRGVYLAPFFNYFKFNSSRTLSKTTDTGVNTVGLETNVSWLSFGGALGYQFVLRDRFVIDILFLGPAIVHYSFKAKLDADIEGLNEDEAVQKVIEAIKEKIPLFKDYAGNGETSTSGSQAFWSAGFNYRISLGYRF